MTKIWMLAMILLSFFPAHSQDMGRFECNPDPYLPSYQLIRKSAQIFSLRAYFPDGFKNAPIYSGDVSAGMINAMEKKKDFVQKFGATYEVDIPLNQCRRTKKDNGHFNIHCFSKLPMKLGSVDIAGISFLSWTRKIETITHTGNDFYPIVDEETVVGVSIGRPTGYGTHWEDLLRTYPSADCRISENFWNN